MAVINSLLRIENYKWRKQDFGNKYHAFLCAEQKKISSLEPQNLNVAGMLDTDENTFAKVERCAALDRISFAQWVEQNLKKAVSAAILRIFHGCAERVKNAPFDLPSQGKFDDDAR